MTTSSRAKPAAAPQRPVHELSSGRVLVTGATRGIGRAVVAALLDRGATVCAVARDREALDRIAGAHPGRVHGLAADLGDADERRGVVTQAADLLGGLDGLVQCAGVVRYQAALETDDEALIAQLELNFLAPFRLAQDAARIMLGQGHGSIVHIASTLALRPAIGTAAYAASKAALLSLTRSLALELAAGGVRVNAVVPGVIDTDMVRVPRGLPGSAPTVAAELAALAELHPLGRLGKPREVAEAVLYLLDAPFVTGVSLAVDGGLTVG